MPGFFSYSTLCRFLKELHNTNLVIQHEFAIFIATAQRLPCLPWAPLTRYSKYSTLCYFCYCDNFSISSMKDWTIITHQYLAYIFLNVKACCISAQPASFANFRSILYKSCAKQALKHCDLASTSVPDLAGQFCNRCLISYDSSVSASRWRTA